MGQRRIHRAAGALVLALVAALGAAACGSPSDDSALPSGFTLSAGQLVTRRADIAGHPHPDRWRTEVAWVDPEIEEMVVHRDAPEEAELAATEKSRRSATVAPVRTADLNLTAQSPSTTDAPPLTPIPSAGLSWGSAEVDGDWVFDNPTVIGSPLVFLVTENHGDWLKVMAPVRPNQQEGWIAADRVTVATHHFHVTVDVTNNHLRVWDGDELLLESGTVDGAPHAPTPLGRFYINETQQVDPYSAYGSYILSTNGFSEALERFGGEVPIFAIHGTAYDGSLGQDISNGCIRVPNEIIERMAAEVPVGTPVDVIA